MTDKQDETAEFHRLAKEAGNQLRSRVLGLSSGAAAALFVALAVAEHEYSGVEITSAALALAAYVTAVVLCLFELETDARRFYFVAKANTQENPDWSVNDRYKRRRYRLIRASQVALFSGVFLSFIFIVLRIAS